MSILVIKPEVMAPAGYWPQLQAAVEAGADAVYFGLKHFTARAKVGFTIPELANVMRALHRRGVRGYLTFNTLVFDHELSEAANAVAAIATSGVDAIIVQDLGMARLARQIAPQLAVHGSTQMSITSAEGVELARQFGVKRVVLARELSMDDIRAIRAQTDCELEIFVHGALCVSYSGQCFSSEAWGGRSANRGQCAQACRLPYDMLVDGEMRPLGAARYLLSPEDLYALREIPQIVKLGISSLKIEGRYKDENYVALTTHAYRKAVDEACQGLSLSLSNREELQLAQVYSRGLGPHFLAGTNHQTVVPGRSPRHRGVRVGRVTEVRADSIVIGPEAAHSLSPVKAGDGLVFDAANWRSPEEREEGGRVYVVAQSRNGTLQLSFANNAIDFARVRAGDWVWRTHDPEIDKVARPFTNAAMPVHKQPVRVAIVARVGEPLSMEWSIDRSGHADARVADARVRVASEEVLASSDKYPATLKRFRDQLGRLGNTPYRLSVVEAVIEGDPFVPSSQLNELRRRAVFQLEALQESTPDVVVRSPLEVLNAAIAAAPSMNARQPEMRLHLLVRTSEQLDAAISVRPDSITLDYLDLYGLRPAVERIETANITARVASPHVLKPSEQRIVTFLLGLKCPIVVRSTGLLHALAASGAPTAAWIGDFSLNAANLLTARALLDFGLQRLTPTHDLNAAQVADLARSAGAAYFEVIAYQHLPVFHMEHCVFCRFLSTGTSYENCGHPCEKHRVALRDPEGRAHPVMADVGCRNTVFGAQAQEASQHLERWRDAGIEHYRLEFVHETAGEVSQIARAFGDALNGRLDYPGLRSRLQRSTPQGITEGSLFVPENYLEVPTL